jgi:phage terminase large subunit-like protein
MGQPSLAELIADATPSERRWILNGVPANLLVWTWSIWARPEQMAPPGDWNLWMVKAGRGWGKTRTGAEWVRDRARNPQERIALVGRTAGDVRDVMVEGESGLLRIFPDDERPLYEPSKRRVTFKSGAVASCFSADEPDLLRGPQHSCFIGQTTILTNRGQTILRDVVVGDMAQTRQGLRPVIDARNRTCRVGTVRLSNGVELTGTNDHPVMTSKGWKQLGELTVRDLVCVGKQTRLDISSDITDAVNYTNTEKSGRKPTGIFQRDRTSATLTGTKQTTHCSICGSYQERTTLHCIHQSNTKRHAEHAASPCAIGETSKVSASRANTKSLNKSERSSGSAMCAEHGSSAGVDISVASVVSTWEDAGNQTVYNLTVDGCHEYFANGVLVHNCFWADELAAWRFDRDAWDNLMFGFRLGSKPRGIITTTPRPTKLVREIFGRSDCVVSGGSTYDNAGNVADSFLNVILSRYEGTRIGRQEINAEILDENPGALWSPKVIERNRVRVAPSLRRVVVAIDPAVTSNPDSDETGIVCAGLGEDGHGYILADLSGVMAALEWAKASVGWYKDNGADRIIAEVNNGGDLVELTIRTVDPHVAYSAVHASRGKIIRAEPIAALYEQGRVHHVGTFAALEDQCTSFDPATAKRSPDRMDAMVWALTELMLGSQGEPRLRTL